MNKYFIKTYGCQMNVHESEKLAGMLFDMGYASTTDINEADVIVFNTCCIRDGVEQKIEGNIGNIKHLKKVNKKLIFAICGCMTQEDNKATYLTKKYPYIDIIFGTHNLYMFEDYLKQRLNNTKNIIDIWDNEKEIIEGKKFIRNNDNFNAWVNIIYGCNNFCTYCIVPYVRGREKSRSIVDIKQEVEMLIKSGYKYITLLGQNVNSYGKDLKDGSNFALLLNELCKMDGDFRIKFMTSHPKDISSEVISTIANNKKICHVIHLPVQSGSNKILDLMNRKYTREKYINLVNEIREKIPNCYLSTDIIVGFPYENDADFMDTYNLINEIKFDGVFAFMYSKRSGTPASIMDNQVDEEIKNKRVNKILKLSKLISKQNDKALLNQEVEVILITNTLVRTHSGKIILIPKTDKPIGEFYMVKIINVTDKLEGIFVE